MSGFTVLRAICLGGRSRSWVEETEFVKSPLYRVGLRSNAMDNAKDMRIKADLDCDPRRALVARTEWCRKSPWPNVHLHHRAGKQRAMQRP